MKNRIRKKRVKHACEVVKIVRVCDSELMFFRAYPSPIFQPATRLGCLHSSAGALILADIDSQSKFARSGCEGKIILTIRLFSQKVLTQPAGCDMMVAGLTIYVIKANPSKGGDAKPRVLCSMSQDSRVAAQAATLNEQPGP